MIAQDFANDANSLAGVLSFFQKKLGLKGEISFLQQLTKGADLIQQEESLKLFLLTASQNQANQAVRLIIFYITRKIILVKKLEKNKGFDEFLQNSRQRNNYFIE